MSHDDLMPEGFELKLHVPEAPEARDILVVVHGISRNADEVFRTFTKTAGNSMIVAAPLFSKRDFPDYQRLGLSGRGKRADLTLKAALEKVWTMTGTQTRRIHLFGFSGGAQFAHRFAMYYPHRVASLHVASAGWYTFPDPDIRWPYGLGRKRVAAVIAARLAHFRAISTTVYVGDRDTARDAALRKSREIDRQQGYNRVERAHRWAAAIGCTDIVSLHGASHSFEQCCRALHTGLSEAVTERILADRHTGLTCARAISCKRFLAS